MQVVEEDLVVGEDMVVLAEDQQDLQLLVEVVKEELKVQQVLVV